MHSRGKARARLALHSALIGLACATCVIPLEGQDRFFRRYGPANGLNSIPVYSLAQDARGFLWVGGQNGLVRFDGAEFGPWARGVIDSPVVAIATSGSDRIAVLTEPGLAYELLGDDRVATVDVPGGSEAGRIRDLVFDGEERLWVIRGDRVLYETDAGWSVLSAEVLEGEVPSRLSVGPDGAVVAATDRSIWRLTSPARASRLAESPDPQDFILLADGRLLVLDGRTGAVREFRAGRVVREVDPFPGPDPPRPISLAPRGETVWVAYDSYLVAIREGRTTAVLDAEGGVDSGGPLFVDREGSLWTGSFTALLQFPEPDTRIWNTRSGLRSQHTRFLGRSGDAVWVTTWGGTGLVVPGSGGSSVRWIDDWVARDDICEDDRGTVWLAAEDTVLRLRGARVAERHPIEDAGWFRCTVDPAGEIWLATAGRLFHGEDGRLRPVAAPVLPEGAVLVQSLLADGSALWVGGEGTLCRGDLIGSARVAEWDCSDLPDAGEITGMIETPNGRTWAATSRAGVLELRDGIWREATVNALIPIRSLFNLLPSTAGGVWILGRDLAWRVAESDRVDGAVTVVERLEEWHGLPLRGGRDLLEAADGTIWLTTALGLVEIPAASRVEIPAPPPVAIFGSLLDEPQVEYGETLTVPRGRRGLELRFTSPSFRDPRLLRYQVRLAPSDPWTDVAGRRSVRWVDLPPRSYQVAVRASLDGRRWTAEPATFGIRVLPPWHRTNGGRAVLGLATIVLLWLVHRTRSRHLLAVERERTRIAMDLHDEIGSALGSIGILSGILAERDEPDGRTRTLARRIGRTAEEVGAALSDIIWSLDTTAGTVGELAARLADAGAGMFADRGVRFRTELPDAQPPKRLAARQRRNLLLIGLEALHNAARHADARSVSLTLRPLGRGLWQLRVEDDGVGIDPERRSASGRGLDTMRQRAEEIGAVLRCDERPEGGTAVTVVFSTGSFGRGMRTPAAWRSVSTRRRRRRTNIA